ncbi:tyrosine phosphatase family-domain-containing protein [Gigaspora rosea]|uniref:diphosphoinositol-polyphosphate diphosphatase n=1 Tax=Gigaspora rosea TaxID=44941 RepID=A0A397V800_9GLOM|nr:tyrosine phosphatase family-domain-containing protein [Gigaspora rosea]
MTTKDDDSTEQQQGSPSINASSLIVSQKPTNFIASTAAFQMTQAWTAASSSGEEQYPYEEELIPPGNFSMVSTWIYRSSFPKKKNFAFLKKLGLKSILTLILEDYPEQNRKFLEANNIKLIQFGIAGNKECCNIFNYLFLYCTILPFKINLINLLDQRNHPILIHCNKGKHRTGCLIGCLRKLQRWTHTSIFDEYRRFSCPKSRSMDQQFIELFDASQVWKLVNRDHIPKWDELDVPW